VSEWIKAYARALGFDLVGIAPAQSPPHAESFLHWLAQGYAGAMEYLQRTAHLRVNPAELLPDARSAVVVGLNYAPAELPDTDYRIARYALGDDYHQVIREKLETLLGAIQAVAPDVRGARLRRLRACAGARFGVAGGAGLVRQEHLPD
jgi:epoxyqueuosine reductase